MPWRRIGEWRYSSTHSLTSALDGGEWSVSHTSRFTSREIAPGTYWIGGWVGPRTVLDAVVKRKIPNPRRESNPRTPIVQPVAQRYTEWGITAKTNILWIESCFIINDISNVRYFTLMFIDSWINEIGMCRLVINLATLSSFWEWKQRFAYTWVCVFERRVWSIKSTDFFCSRMLSFYTY
jgi:hypothetical protein